jgi:hypothetical protein
VEPQLLASGAVQRQREQRRQQQQCQQQQGQGLTQEEEFITGFFAWQSWDLLELQIKALVVTSRSCPPPELLQQAGLQLLQALAALLQQWQLSSSSDVFVRNPAVTRAVPHFGETLQLLVTAACGAQPTQNPAAGGGHHELAVLQ